MTRNDIEYQTTPTSPADGEAIKAQLIREPSWPAKLAAQWGISVPRATTYLNKAQEGHRAKSVL